MVLSLNIPSKGSVAARIWEVSNASAELEMNGVRRTERLTVRPLRLLHYLSKCDSKFELNVALYIPFCGAYH